MDHESRSSVHRNEIAREAVKHSMEDIPAPQSDFPGVLRRGVILRSRRIRIYSAVGAVAILVTAGLTWQSTTTMNTDGRTGPSDGDAVATPQEIQDGYPSPSFDAPEGWYTDQSGTLPQDTTDQPAAWLSTHDFSQPEYRNLYERLGELPPDGIAIEATIIGAEEYPSPPNANFPPRELPLNLDDAEILNSWEGQPEGIPKYRILGNVEGELLEARIYFGRLNPTKDQYQSAAEALETLGMPERS